MVIAHYEPTAFGRTMEFVVIVAAIVGITIFHVLLIGMILKSKKTAKGKRIIGMVAIASIFWTIALISILMGYAIMDQLPILLSIFFLFGAFLLCFGTGLGYLIAFNKRFFKNNHLKYES